MQDKKETDGGVSDWGNKWDFLEMFLTICFVLADGVAFIILLWEKGGSVYLGWSIFAAACLLSVTLARKYWINHP